MGSSSSRTSTLSHHSMVSAADSLSERINALLKKTEGYSSQEESRRSHSEGCGFPRPSHDIRTLVKTGSETLANDDLRHDADLAFHSHPARDSKSDFYGSTDSLARKVRD